MNPSAVSIPTQSGPFVPEQNIVERAAKALACKSSDVHFRASGLNGRVLVYGGESGDSIPAAVGFGFNATEAVDDLERDVVRWTARYEKGGAR